MFKLGNIYEEFWIVNMEEIISCLQIITSTQSNGGKKLSDSLRTLDSITHDSNIDLNPRLRHFLENRSYIKALQFLQGENPEKGVCGK